MVFEVFAVVFVVLVAAIHVFTLVLEMFLWRGARARAVFGSTPEFADATAVMAANQGLYNGFLAAGLIWSLIAGGDLGHAVALFFMAFVVIAGVYGAATASRKILYVQALPAAIGLVFLLLS